MNWININVTDLDSEEFLGSSPVERATWLCLLRYCSGQENGGRIAGAVEWGDRKWQQVVRVTQEEVLGKCELWSWEGDDLVVWRYPAEKELEVKTNRVNGSKGGRPGKKAADGGAEVRDRVEAKPRAQAQRITEPEPIPEPIPEPKPKPNQVVSDGLTGRFEIAETERNGIGIGIGKEGKLIPPNPPVGGSGFVSWDGDGDGDAPEVAGDQAASVEEVGGEVDEAGRGGEFGEPSTSTRTRTRTMAEAEDDGGGGREFGEPSTSRRTSTSTIGVAEVEGGRGGELGEPSTRTIGDEIGEVESAEEFVSGERGGALKVPMTEQARRLGAIMRRGAGEQWSVKEVRYYHRLGKVAAEEIALVGRYYAEHWPPDREKNMLKHDLASLLRNWPGEVTRARHCGERAERPRYTQL